MGLTCVRERVADHQLDAWQSHGWSDWWLHCRVFAGCGALEEQVAPLPVLQHAGAICGMCQCCGWTWSQLLTHMPQVGASLKVFEMIKSDSSFVQTVRDNTHHFRKYVDLSAP